MAADRLRQKLADMKIRLNQAEARNDSFKESLREVNGRIENAEVVATTLRRQATVAEVELKRITNRLDGVEERLWKTKEDLRRSEEVISSLSQEEDQLLTTQGELNEKLKSVKNTVTLNESILKEAQRRIKAVELQKKLAEKRCERLTELEHEVTNKLRFVGERIEQLQGNPRSGMSAQEETALEERIAELKSSYRESAMKAELAQRQVSALTHQRNVLSKELKEITDKKKSTQDELNRIYDEFGSTL